MRLFRRGLLTGVRETHVKPAHIVFGFIAVLAATLSAVPGKADGWPQQPVDYIIPFGYGGESGITARLQQSVFRQLTGHDLVISHTSWS